jgi:5'-nucleotidase
MPAARRARPLRAAFAAAAVGLAAVAGLAACAPPRAAAPAPRPAPGAVLRILHLNDVYEISPVEGGRTGGLARVAALRRALADTTPALITTLGGDYLSPSAIGTARVGGSRLAGRQMVAAMNALGLDVAVLGNHEFDLGEAVFRAHLAQARFACSPPTSPTRRGGRSRGCARTSCSRAPWPAARCAWACWAS